MNTLALDPKIIAIANSLKVRGSDPVAAIREYCRERVTHFVRQSGAIKSIGALQKLVCDKLNLTVHEVWNDDDLAAVAARYVAEGEIVFAALGSELSADTFGILIRLNRRDGSRFRWVAVVDCRGDKHLRRFFTLWHEIAHCLVAVDQYELPFHRTTITSKPKDPNEKLTDIIAGDLGFFEPVFGPVFDRHFSASARVTFDFVERVRIDFCPECSFQAALNACVSRTPYPLLLIDAGLEWKKAEKEQMRSTQRNLFPDKPPVPKLRVLTCIANTAARSRGLHIPRKLRVPESSVIMRVHEGELGDAAFRVSVENLDAWSSSTGGALASQEVSVEARKYGEHVMALVSPLPPSKTVPASRKSQPAFHA